jgi:hypothetical protein
MKRLAILLVALALGLAVTAQAMAGHPVRGGKIVIMYQ